MCSCISPVIANIYMKYFGRTAITTFHSPPSMRLRHADDTSSMLLHIKQFYEHLNSIYPHKQFIMVKGRNTSFLVVVVLVTREVRKQSSITNTTLFTGIHKKTLTPTDTFTTSLIIQSIKNSVHKTLIHGANTLVSNKNHLRNQLHNVRFALRLNKFASNAA